MMKKYASENEYQIKTKKDDVFNKMSMEEVEKRIADLNEQINNK